jgi:hypothetical protein
MKIHPDIKHKLDYFIDNKQVPHILFYGHSGSGKRHILKYMLDKIYTNVLDFKTYVMYIDCAFGKGIKYIRDEVKFFAKTNVNHNNGVVFKSIVLLNADKLTMDAQSALRRCIEQFSNYTRFFIIVNNYETLLKPILSRFCNIYIPLPIINNVQQSLHTYNQMSFNDLHGDCLKKRTKWLKQSIRRNRTYTHLSDLIKFVNVLYQRGYSGVDILHYIRHTLKHKQLIIYLENIKRDFRNEQIFMLYMLILVYVRPMCVLENIL